MSKVPVILSKQYKFRQVHVFTIFKRHIRTSGRKPEKPKSCNLEKLPPYIELNDGQKLPRIGYGTWLIRGKPLIDGVVEAVRTGYRLVDTAFVYDNEIDVGLSIKECIRLKLIKNRRDVFITSKLWNTYHSPKSVEKAMRITLANLQMSHLNLYLMHWPSGYEEDTGKFLPKNACGRVNYSNVDYVDTWKAMESLVKNGLTKSIGIANFNKSQLERLLQKATIPPVVLQAECHPFLNQSKLMAFCKKNKIVFQAYSPLGSSADRPYAVEGEERVMEANELKKIEMETKKTRAQILLLYQIQRGNAVIARSTIPDQIRENFQVFDWELTGQQMKILNSLNRNKRYVIKTQEFGTHKYFPFNDEY